MATFKINLTGALSYVLLLFSSTSLFGQYVSRNPAELLKESEGIWKNEQGVKTFEIKGTDLLLFSNGKVKTMPIQRPKGRGDNIDYSKTFGYAFGISKFSGDKILVLAHVNINQITIAEVLSSGIQPYVTYTRDPVDPTVPIKYFPGPFFSGKNYYFLRDDDRLNLGFLLRPESEITHETRREEAPPLEYVRTIEESLFKIIQYRNSYFMLEHLASGLFVTIDERGNNVSLRPRVYSPYQDWIVTADPETGACMIVPRMYPIFLGLSGHDIVLNPERYYFKMYPEDSPPTPPAPQIKAFNIESRRLHGQVIEFDDPNPIEGSNVSIAPQGSNPNTQNRKFEFVPAGQGFYFIQLLTNSDLVLEVDQGLTDDGTNIRLAKKDGSNKQRFKKIRTRNIYNLVSALAPKHYLGLSDDDRNIVLRKGYPGGKRVGFFLRKVSP